ncbi:MAG: hypothetical protein OXE03_05795 [Gammaproteobacteria bacterium]|nr:hypothetical protein [Gammaproteobacteria bacterium]
MWVKPLLLVSLFIFGAAGYAEAPVRNVFNQEEMILVAEANLAFTSCLQEAAPEQLESSPDVRVVAANIVQTCNSILADLQTTLEQNGVNPAFFMRAVTRIKNRAIRRLLPLLMMEKSNQTP